MGIDKGVVILCADISDTDFRIASTNHGNIVH